MPVTSFAACVLSSLWADLWVTLIYLFISVCLWFKRKCASHRFSSDKGLTTHCFREQPCGTHNPISGLTVVAHWPVDSPHQPRHNPRKKLQRGERQSESRSPQTGHSTLGQRAGLQSLLWQAVSTTPTPAEHPSIGAAASPGAGHVCTSAVSLWQLEANKRWKAERAILTVYRKHGRHREQRRFRGLDPSPSTHSLRRVTGSLKGLFSSSKHSGWKTPECGGSVNRGKRGRETSTRRSISQTKSSFRQNNRSLQGTVPLNHTIMLSFHKWTLLVYFSASASYLKHSITIIFNGPFTSNVELCERSPWAETQRINCFPVIDYGWDNAPLVASK